MRHKATFVVPSSTCFWWFTVFLCVPFFSDTIHNVRARRPSCRWGQLDCIAVMVIMLSRTEAVITHWQRVSHSWTRRWRDTEWNQRHDSSPWLNLRRREAGRRRRCQRPQPRPGIHCAGHIHPHHIRASLERSDWHALRLRQCLPPIPAAAAAEVTCRFPRRRDVASDNRLCEHACATAPTAGRRVGEKWGGGWLNESWEGVSVPALTNG